jgi:hypothetical protein
MVTMFFIMAMSPSVPTVVPVFPVLTFAGMDVIVFSAWHVHGLRLDPHGGGFFFDLYLNPVDDGAAASHFLRPVGWLGRHTLANHDACYRTDGGRRGAAIPVPELIAEQTAGNASDDCATGVIAALRHVNLLVPALLARTFDRPIFGCKCRCGQDEGQECQVGFDVHAASSRSF